MEFLGAVTRLSLLTVDLGVPDTLIAKKTNPELVEKAFPPLGGEQVKICVWRVLQKHLVPGKARISPGKLSLPA